MQDVKIIARLVSIALVFLVAVLSIASGKEKGDTIIIEAGDQFTEEGSSTAGSAIKKLIVMYEKMNANIKIEQNLVTQKQSFFYSP